MLKSQYLTWALKEIGAAGSLGDFGINIVSAKPESKNASK